jgi:Zn-dependent peptidase ImmA (M78 family)
MIDVMKIRVDGATLKSLRQRYKATIEVASKMTKVDQNELSRWEQDGVELSITDAKALARAFHSHWSVFLLRSEVKPIKEPINHRAGYSDNSPFSMSTLRAYEIARKLLDSSSEIEGQTIDPRIDAIRHLGQAGEDPTFIAKKTRELLGVDSKAIQQVRSDAYSVYRFWKERISSIGIYVSEQGMPEEETKAFLLKDKDRAIIVVNKKDKYIYSRVFSMLHELGHLVKGESSAACKDSIYARRASGDETWCNRFASELAAPDDEVMADEVIQSIKGSNEPAAIIRRLSSKHRISFTVMLYKLKRHNKLSDKQCTEMHAFFDKVIMPKIKNEGRNASKQIRLGKAYYVGKDLSKASVGLSREVIERQMQGSITYTQAAKLLDTKTKYLEDIKEAVGFGK